MKWFDSVYGGELPFNTPDVSQIPDYPDTSLADYVWLPVRFHGEMAYLDWKEEWRVEHFE